MMKHSFFILTPTKYVVPGTLLLAVLLFFSACKKDEPLPPAEPQHLIELGKIACTIGDKKSIYFGSLNMVSNRSHFSLSTGFTFAYPPNIDETLAFAYIPLKVGKHPIHSFPTSNFGTPRAIAILDWTIEIDQPVAQLKTTDDYPDDFIEVVRLDTINKVVEGRFQFHLKNMDNDNPHLATFNLPSEMYVSEGVFHLKVE
jgi:hypothetical protein